MSESLVPWRDPVSLGFTRISIRLRLSQPVRFHFNHGGVLRGLLGRALAVHEVPSTVVPFAPESGRVDWAAGDVYQVGVTLIGDGRSMATRLAEGLTRVGKDRSIRATLSGNFELIEARELPSPDLAAEMAILRARPQTTIRFLSPFRLERPPALKAEHAAYVSGDCFPVDHFLRRLFKRLFFLARGHYPDSTEEDRERPPLTPDDAAPETRLLWLDVPIESLPRAGRQKGYTIGGVLGTVTLTHVPDVWLPSLVLGRYLHAGESTNYGFGRYRFCVEPLEQAEDFRPTATVIERAASTPRLASALEHLRAKSHAAGLDGESPEDFDGLGQDALEDLGRLLRTGRYQPQPLLGFLHRNPDGRVRPLAIPAVRDRIAQRAVVDVVAPAIDSMLEDCSFAYRKGLSRQSAARAIEEAWAQGYRYVLDADISAFFDSVDWQRLFEKLHALFPLDPAVELLKVWVRDPVVFDGRRIERRRGLPQGSPISPLLANLFLDEFDEELLGRDYRLIRYADDFVVLCKDLDAARNARELAQQTLEKLGLALNEDKTAIRAIDSGFTYLGYLFCRSLAIDELKPMEPEQWDLPADAVPTASWLAQVPFERVKALASQQRRSGRKVAEPIALQADSGTGLMRRPLYVTNADTLLSLRDETLVLERAGEQRLQCPVRSLSHVMFVGRVRASLPLVVKLHEFGVPVYLCRRSGELITAFVPHAPEWPLWLAQARLAQNGSARLAVARTLVAAKLHNTAWLVRRFPVPDGREVAVKLAALEADVTTAGERDRLSGFEGAGAALFFDVFRRNLDPIWGFDGRRKHPPTDPVNSMLSFGYTMLYNHVSTALVAAGLNPRLGVFHQEHGAHHALASDLMEPFRFLVDGLVWAMVKRREVSGPGFLARADGEPCLMAHAFRRTFIARVERRLQTLHTPSGGDAENYRETIDRAARQMRELVAGRASGFEAFRAGERLPAPASAVDESDDL